METGAQLVEGVSTALPVATTRGISRRDGKMKSHSENDAKRDDDVRGPDTSVAASSRHWRKIRSAVAALAAFRSRRVRTSCYRCIRTVVLVFWGGGVDSLTCVESLFFYTLSPKSAICPHDNPDRCASRIKHVRACSLCRSACCAADFSLRSTMQYLVLEHKQVCAIHTEEVLPLETDVELYVCYEVY